MRKNEIDERGLTASQRLFVAEYVKDWNATRAILRLRPHIGEKSARTEGWRMLTQAAVRAEVNRIEKERAANLRTQAEDIERALAELAYVDLLDIFDDRGDLKPLSEIPPHARRAIAAIDVESREGRDGQTYTVKKVRLWDKKGALELLGRYRKMFTDRVETEHRGAVSIQIDTSGK